MTGRPASDVRVRAFGPAIVERELAVLRCLELEQSLELVKLPGIFFAKSGACAECSVVP
jgi:hypothetical protein